MWRVLAFSVLGLSLTGCTWLTNYFAGKDNAEPPTPLTEIQDKVELRRLWSVDVGAGSGEQALRLAPTVVQDRIFVADRRGGIQARELSSGKPIWEVDAKAPISGGPGVGEGLALVGTRDGRVLAFSADEGKPVWETRVSSEVLSVPKAADGVVVVRTIDGRITGLSATDGSIVWNYDRSVPALSLRGTSSPALSDGVAVSGFDNGRLVALLLENGQPLWEQTIAVPRGRSELERMVDIDGDPVVADRVVFVVTYQGRISALALDAGRLLWSRDMSSFAGLGLDSLLFVTDERSQVWGLDPRTGASLWKQDQLAWRGLSKPATFREYAIVGDFEGYLHLLSQRDGSLAGRMRVSQQGFAAEPVVAGDVVLTLDKGGQLTAFAPMDAARS